MKFSINYLFSYSCEKETISRSSIIHTSSEAANTHLQCSVHSLSADQDAYCSLSYVNEQSFQDNNSFGQSEKIRRSSSSENINETKYKWSDSETTV